MANAELDERLMVAMRVARQHHLSIWDAAFQEHRGHPTFRMFGSPHSLEIGFTCVCAHEQEISVSIRDLKEMLPEARESIIRVYRQHMHRGQGAARRRFEKAEVRARALLHRYLTPLQRLELRKTKAFTMRGKDGRSYYMTLGFGSNIVTEHEGVKYRLCVVPKGALPKHDVLLAQKIMLETEPEAFLRLAKVMRVDQVEGRNVYYESGAFILGGEVKEKAVEPAAEIIAIIAFPNEVLENPREWVETRCRD